MKCYIYYNKNNKNLQVFKSKKKDKKLVMIANFKDNGKKAYTLLATVRAFCVGYVMGNNDTFNIENKKLTDLEKYKHIEIEE